MIYRQKIMTRLLDFTLSILGLLILAPVMLLIFILGIFDTGSPIFIQCRVGRLQRPFNLMKFRTMNVKTDSVATHLADASAITPLGRFLRQTKIDELPQLWNVLLGDMSLVGPRPCQFNQTELIEERVALGIFDVRPGITGLAQIKKIDMSTPALLAKTEKQMLNTLSVRSYLKYVILTVLRHGTGDRIRK